LSQRESLRFWLGYIPNSCSMYIKGDKAHLVLDVKRKENIPYLDLINLLKSPLDLMPIVEQFSGEKFEKDKLDIKVTLQSPGIIEIIYFASPVILFGLALVMHYIVGGKIAGKYTRTEKESNLEIEGSSDGLLEKWLKFRRHADSQRLKELEAIREVFNKLDVKIPKELKNLPIDTHSED